MRIVGRRDPVDAQTRSVALELCVFDGFI